MSPSLDPASAAFEHLARAFLTENPSIAHEWRPSRSIWLGDHLELILTPPAPHVPGVWASLTAGQITIGAKDSHRDFEDFGRGLTDEQLAEEAFSYFQELAQENGYVARSTT